LCDNGPAQGAGECGIIYIVIPAKAGIHQQVFPGGPVDSRLRGNDELFQSVR